MKRRQFLKIAGGGTILAAAAGTGYAMTRTPTAALAPWADAGAARYADPRMRALSWAILAPNPHNQQPWLVEMEGEDAFVLRFNPEKQLPHTDPFDRQLCIGFGCFLELMTMAAGVEGYVAETELFPDGEDAEDLASGAVARVRLIKGEAVVDPLWTQVPDRRSLKEPFDTGRPVAADALARIVGAGRHGPALGGSVSAEDIAYWRVLTTAALMVEVETPRTHKESVDVFRIGKREVNENPDGIDFSGPFFETMNRVGMFTREGTMDKTSFEYAAGIDAITANSESAMGHVWMVTQGNTRADQIAAGRDWLRVNLAATAEGIGFQPLSQALQEYPEMEELYAETHARLAPEGGTVQMLARIGYGPDVAPSPRWAIEKKVLTA